MKASRAAWKFDQSEVLQMSEPARGVRTNGIGQFCDSHLNLTRTMADVWAVDPPTVAGGGLERTNYVAPTPIKFRLRDRKGQYLDAKARGLTLLAEDAWMGTDKQLYDVFMSNDLARGMVPVAVAS